MSGLKHSEYIKIHESTMNLSLLEVPSFQLLFKIFENKHKELSIFTIFY